MKRIIIAGVTLLTVFTLGACSNGSRLSDYVRPEDSSGAILSQSEAYNYERDGADISEKESSDVNAADSEVQSLESAESDSTESTEPESKIMEQESTETENTENNQNGSVDPELKAVLDEYEAFMDEYIAFMGKYENSDNMLDMLSDYAEIMKQYAGYMSTIEKYNPNEMSAADAAYYIEVTSRVSQKLLEAAY